MIKTVIKRDGTEVAFDANQLTKWAEWASVIGVDWFEIVSEAYKKCDDGCSTQDLHKALIQACVDKETTNHLLMAGRLYAGSIYKDVFGGHCNIPNLFDFYNKMVEEGLWEQMDYSGEELNLVDKYLDHTFDLDMSYTALLQDTQKYSLKDMTTKELKESPQFTLIRMALGSNKNQPKERRMDDVRNDYFDLVRGKVNTPTPNKTNLGTNSRSYASCCKSMANDTESSIEAQNHVMWKMTCASAGQGGYMQIRSVGDKVRGGRVKHGGKLPYIRNHKEEVNSNKQGERGGALTEHVICLDPEIFTLLGCRNPTTVDSKRIDGIDYSFMYNNVFIDRCKQQGNWLLISFADAPDLWESMFEKTDDNFKVLLEKYEKSGKGVIIKAFDLLKKFLQENEVSGRWYEFNASAVNRHTSFIDPIYSSNLCQEYLAPTSGYKDVTGLYDTNNEIGEVAICNLSAIVAGRVSEKEYGDVAYRTLLRIDNIIDITEFPLPQVDKTAKARRSVGVGLTNVAYAMASQGLSYSSKFGKDYLHRLAELHLFSLLKASVQLAKEKGKCEWWDKTMYSKGWLPIDTYNKEVDNITSQRLLCDWEGLRAEIKEYGMRHSVLVNHMPCESSAIRNNDTNGLYPVRDGVLVKTSGNTKNVFIAPEWESLKGYYDIAWDIPHNDLADDYAIFQKFADGGISADFYHKYEQGKPKKVSLKLLAEQFFYRNKVGLKTRYYKNFYIGAGQVEQEDACSGGGCKL